MLHAMIETSAKMLVRFWGCSTVLGPTDSTSTKLTDIPIYTLAPKAPIVAAYDRRLRAFQKELEGPDSMRAAQQAHHGHKARPNVASEARQEVRLSCV